MCETRLKSEIKCFEFSLKRWVQFWHSTFIPLVISYGWLRYFNFARLKGNYSKRGALSFLPFFPFFPSPSSLFSFFLPFFFPRCLDESSVFRKTPCQSFREIVCSRWWRNSIAHGESSKFLEGRMNAEFPTVHRHPLIFSYSRGSFFTVRGNCVRFSATST